MASTNSNTEERTGQHIEPSSAIDETCLCIVTNDDKKCAELKCLIEQYKGGVAVPNIEQCRVRIGAADSFARFKNMGCDRWAEMFACDERHRESCDRVFWLFERTWLHIDALGEIPISVDD